MIFIYIISARTDAKHCCITIPSIPLLHISTYPVTLSLRTLLLHYYLLCYLVSTYFVTLSSIIMSFAFCQQYYCSNHNSELWIMNFELILVFGGYEKSLENLLISISKL